MASSALMHSELLKMGASVCNCVQHNTFVHFIQDIQSLSNRVQETSAEGSGGSRSQSSSVQPLLGSQPQAEDCPSFKVPSLTTKHLLNNQRYSNEVSEKVRQEKVNPKKENGSACGGHIQKLIPSHNWYHAAARAAQSQQGFCVEEITQEAPISENRLSLSYPVYINFSPMLPNATKKPISPPR